MAYDDAGGYANQSYVSLISGTYNNVDRTLVPQYTSGGVTYAQFSSGSTRVLYILPTGGNVTITGFSAAEASSGHTFIVTNEDLTGSSALLFPNQTGSNTGNQFKNLSLGTVAIYSGGAARVTWLYPPGASSGYWRFA